MSLVELPPDHTGGNFSVIYTVQNEATDQKGFLKAVDLLKEMNNTKRLNEKLTNYHYEERILQLCRELEMDGVVIALGSGKHIANFHGLDVEVPYLIFEKADGDLRTHQKAQDYNLEWRLWIFHGACVSLRQLHRAEIAHQDIKPSNILIFDEMRAKIADLGHSTKRGLPSSYELDDHPGDGNYVPVELLYRHYHKGNWIRRRLGADMFMMGCLLTYLVSDSSLLTLMFERLDKRFWRENWKGSYEEVMPHLEMAMDEALFAVKQNLPANIAEDVCHLIRSLSHPNCHRRGRPYLFGDKWEEAKMAEPEAYLREQYSFEYVISRVDVIAKRARIGGELNKEPFRKFLNKQVGT